MIFIFDRVTVQTENSSYFGKLECVHCHAIKIKSKTMQRTKSKNCDIVDDK